FGVERDEVNGSADLSGGVVRSTEAVLDKIAGEAAAVAGGVRAADARRGQCAAHGDDGVIVQLEEFLGRSAPVTDIGLVPNLPVPRLDFGAPVFFEAVLRPLKNEFGPLFIILWRVGPPGVNLLVTGPRRPFVLIRLRLDGKIFRHEADLDVR